MTSRDTTVPTLVELTEEEKELASRIEFDPDSFTPHEDIWESCEAAYPLAKSLLARHAIPQIRLEYFTDPEHNIGLKRSHKEVFESNGTRGEDILRHPNFLRYLRYFIYGPNLPDSTISGFCRLVEEDRGTSGEVLSALRAYARREVRDKGLDRLAAAEEFYKLAIECGAERFARSIREAALTARGSKRHG